METEGIPYPFQAPQLQPIMCIEMHTTGEPTRIVYKGFPKLSGTLLEQRAEAKLKHDHIRSRLLLEPRGHVEMYGALLRHETELTATGQAHIGVLFMTNDGYSTMCGHATIALGRFLVDCHDPIKFPKRSELKHDPSTNTTSLRIHAPCGLIKVTVPTTPDGLKADPSRPVSFICVPSFASGIQINIPVSQEYQWPELQQRGRVIADFCYGGAFYCVISATELGFRQGLRSIDFDAMKRATRLLKAAVQANQEMRRYFTHPDHADLGFLYSILVIDETVGKTALGSIGSETSLCYFADEQIDRSPTGSAVAARAALAYAKGRLKMNETWTYNSLVSNAFGGRGYFIGSVVEDCTAHESSLPYPLVKVKVEGYAFYTGFHSFVVEKDDPLGEDGFIFEKLDT